MACMGVFASSVVALSLASASGSAWAGQPEGVDDADAGDPTAVDGGIESTLTADASTSSSADTSYDDSSAADDTESDAVEADGGASASLDSSSSSASVSTSAAAPADGGAPAPIVDSGTGIDPFKGRLAVGAIRTIAGINGINVRYFVTDQLAVGASAGVALFAYKENDPTTMDVCPGDDCTFENTRTVVGMGFNAEALYFAKLGREAGTLPFRADFGIGGRFGIISVVNANDAPDNLDDPLEMHIEIPIVFQLMFGNNFALSPELGMDFRIVPGTREAGDSNPGTGFPPTVSGDAVTGPGFGWEITPGVGLFAGASMHYIFGGR